MTETYCGKICADCEHKESMDCPGCKAGPGRSWARECEIAQCVRTKGHETCDTCGFSSNCGSLRGRERMPQYRQQQAAAEAQHQAEIARRAPFLGKWLWILFWLIIPSIIAGILTNDSLVALVPELRLPGQILNVVVSAAYAVILFRLSTEEERYKKAAICSLIASGLSILSFLVPAEAGQILALVLAVPAAIAALIGEYNEYMAHAAVLSDVDSVLSGNWELLWKWYIGLFGVMLGSIFLIILAPVLGAIVMLLAAIGTVIVSIFKLVCLFRTAQTLREYAK